ncbi:MAG TPA: glycoside hydrolase family 19 protein [Armatimonadota bacterium]|jgi:hypothetical protein
MSKLRDPHAVAQATGCTESDVAQALPIILEALQEQGLLQINVVIGALATVAVECSFKPVEEAYYLKPAPRMRYFDTTKYARVDPETGKRYNGRGYIQLTWRSNYEKYGKLLGLDLVHQPELCLQIHTAARVLAAYFKQCGVDVVCKEADWEQVRRRVNGGLNGYERFIGCVRRLQPLAQ